MGGFVHRVEFCASTFLFTSKKISFAGGFEKIIELNFWTVRRFILLIRQLAGAP